MAAQNLVNAELLDADQTEAKVSVTNAQNKLPFLITLTTKEKTRLRKMGFKSVEYIKKALMGAENFPEYMPASFNTINLAKHSKLIDQLMDI